MNTIQSQWERYRACLCAAGLSAADADSLRYSFYAGAAGMLEINRAAAMMKTDAAVHVLRGCTDELLEYLKPSTQAQVMQSAIKTGSTWNA